MITTAVLKRRNVAHCCVRYSLVRRLKNTMLYKSTIIGEYEIPEAFDRQIFLTKSNNIRNLARYFIFFETHKK